MYHDVCLSRRSDADCVEVDVTCVGSAARAFGWSASITSDTAGVRFHSRTVLWTRGPERAWEVSWSETEPYSQLAVTVDALCAAGAQDQWNRQKLECQCESTGRNKPVTFDPRQVLVTDVRRAADPTANLMLGFHCSRNKNVFSGMFCSINFVSENLL